MSELNNQAADDQTQLVADATQVMPPLGGNEATSLGAVHTAAKPQTDPNLYTQFGNAGTNSTGFAKAQALVQQTLAGHGTLLKKRFVLEGVLGVGGMGTVYKTRDLRKIEAQDPNPYIATKVLNQDFKDHPSAFVTLQQETAKSQTLAHPNIVTVHDFDRDGDTLFMTMELLEGEPLDKLLKANQNTGLPKLQAFNLTQDMGAALAYAHQRQLIHADFKPGNVFVTTEGRAKVLDFGIARAASAESQKHHFDAGSLGALTPAYATLEMLRGEATSFADDVYALACVVYEMLSGTHPYQRQSALIAQQQKLKPKRLDVLTTRQWGALQHGLALEKSARTATVDQFLAELFPKRSARLTKIALVGVAVSLLGAGWFGYQQYQAKQKIQTTVAEKIEAAQTCFANSDFTCAIKQSSVAASLDTNNKIAASLLQNAQVGLQQQQKQAQIKTLLNAAEACLNQKNYACAQVKARELLELDVHNTAATALLQQATELTASQEISGAIRQAQDCLAKNDLDCAALLSEQVNTINKQHPDAQALALKLRAAQLQAQQQQTAAAGKLQVIIAAAQKCLQSQNYDCTLVQANKALLLDKSNTQAVEIKQAAAIAKQQALETQSKVAVILEQAQGCLDKKNYNCAIAKSEAALDLIPQHPAALAIRSNAQETQRRIKESSFNIK